MFITVGKVAEPQAGRQKSFASSKGVHRRESESVCYIYAL